MNYQGRTALVTGASSGIGASYARGLAARGCNLVLVARREQRLKELAHELEGAHGITAHVVPADLSSEDAAGNIRAATDKLGLRVDILVNNAGFGTYGPYETIDPKTDRQQVLVNIAAMVDLTHAYLPDMVKRADGSIINVSSIAALQPTPYVAVYGASKSFILSFSEALWAENRKRGVRVLACLPGATDTEYFDVIGNNDEVVFGSKVPPKVVVDKSLRALERRRPSKVVGLRYLFNALMPRLLPRADVLLIAERIARPKNKNKYQAA
jgi:short-subunit dehydrogenase